MSSLESLGIPIHFTWCPAHCDIKENEQADVLAGAAANRRKADAIVLRPRSVYASDIRQARARTNVRQRTALRDSRYDNHECLSRLLVIQYLSGSVRMERDLSNQYSPSCALATYR